VRGGCGSVGGKFVLHLWLGWFGVDNFLFAWIEVSLYAEFVSCQIIQQS
jgi:hypothetical protein